MKKGLAIVLGFFALIVAVLVIGVLWAVGINNKMVQLNQAVNAQWADVQNVYQRRADLIPNLVNTVKGAANFEKSTLENVVQARASVGSVKLDANTAPNDPEKLRQFQAAQDRLSSAVSRLLVVVERYPELKANQNFLTLQAQLEGTENRITEQRRRFNEAVRGYNTYIQQFPASFIASFRNFQPKPYFEATAGSERPPQVQFDFSNKTAQ